MSRRRSAITGTWKSRAGGTAMNVAGKVVVVTGAAAGIGAALCRAFLQADAATVVAADIDEAAMTALCEELGCAAHRCDVSVETDIDRLVDTVQRRLGPISLFFSNAGI